MEENSNVIEINMAQLQVSQAPCVLITRALGSCVGVTLYDAEKKIGGMAHAMLPDISKGKNQSNPARFVNSAIIKMIEDLEKMGCSRKNLVAKLFGGAHMFSFISADSMLNIGQKNTDMALSVLKDLGIRISAQEIGGTFGRTIELNLDTGTVLVKTISWGDKEV